MRIFLGLAATAGFLLCSLPTETFAQSRAGSGALIGGASGAIIGGATRGGRGAAVGAAIGASTGAIIGSQMQRRGRYYWYNGRCWVRFRNGEFHPIANRYCR